MTYLHPEARVALMNGDEPKRSRPHGTGPTDLRNDAARDLDERAPREDQRSNSVVEVTVATVGDYRFSTTEGATLVWTRFREPNAFWLPSPGDRVRVGLDKAGYVRGMTLLQAAAPIVEETAPAEQVAPAEERERVVLSGGLQTDDRGRAIARMNALTTATAILSSGGGAATIEEVFALATKIEGWIFR